MALPTAFSRSRAPSRRDHVLNLLPPLSVLTKDEAAMHHRLFADNPPPKNYPDSLPNKVLRHLGPWTFYSAPTKGELAILDRSMYNLRIEDKKEVVEDGNTDGPGKAKRSENACKTGYNKNVKKRGTKKRMKNADVTVKETSDGGKDSVTTHHKVTQKSNLISAKTTTNSRNTSNLSNEQSLQLKGMMDDLNSDHTASSNKTVKRQSIPKSGVFNKRQIGQAVNGCPRKTGTKVEILFKKPHEKLLGDVDTRAASLLEIVGFPVQRLSSNARKSLPISDCNGNSKNGADNRETYKTAKSIKTTSDYDYITSGPRHVNTTRKIEIPLLKLAEGNDEERLVSTPVSAGDYKHFEKTDVLDATENARSKPVFPNQLECRGTRQNENIVAKGKTSLENLQCSLKSAVDEKYVECHQNDVKESVTTKIISKTLSARRKRRKRSQKARNKSS